jgi:hypothetical protein
MERKEPKFKTFEFSNKILDYAAYQYEEPTNLEIMEEKVIGVSKVLPKFLLGCPDEILPGLKTSLLLIDLLKELFRQIKQVKTKCKKKKETAEESLGRGDIEEAIGYLTYYFHSEMVQHLGKATDELKKLWVVLEEAITDIHTMGTDFCESFRCYANGRSWKRTFKKNKMKIKTES